MLGLPRAHSADLRRCAAADSHRARVRAVALVRSAHGERRSTSRPPSPPGALTYERLGSRSASTRIDAYDKKGPAAQRRASRSTRERSRPLRALDAERQAHGQVRAPLHGMPIVGQGQRTTTADLPTAAGSTLALAGTQRRASDATVVRRLRDAGADQIYRQDQPARARATVRHGDQLARRPDHSTRTI